ncbi:MAG: hypothetical protein EPN72_09105 [Nevskiaceae bacterium]|nr:MAG: hypothetical protein EPN63_08445 [Nevskiaceae bacterium]TBR72596.1 MAG: hypothetical protein EPN72_09105 [Nevskiaceae bacterium]
MRVGFLYNHDQIHQVAHSLPIATALAREFPDVEVVLATTNDALDAAVDRLLAAGAGPRIGRVRLRLKSPLRRALSPLLNPLLPFDKAAIYGDNLAFFRSLDALVVTEKTSLLLKSRYGLGTLRLIHCRHGAGDRAIGFNAESARFDQVLVSGPKIRDRLIREAHVPAERISTVGYPKFDLLPATPPRLPLQANGRPTVLYNPHPAPHLSSWYALGQAVLRYFRDSTRYNLIFAPHVMLFQRRWVPSLEHLGARHVGRVPQDILDCPHIHVDLGSPASTDMTYTQAADLYLGDASSQVYEFLQRPRPCVFLNPDHLQWRGDPNFAHWTAGPVVSDLAELDAALARSAGDVATYRPVQQQLFACSFDLNGEASSLRAARAIHERLHETPLPP